MTTKYRHPFLEGLKDVPEGHEKDLADVRNWLTQQPHLPALSDDQIYLFLHSCYWQREQTRETIESYCTIRAGAPDLFLGRDPLSQRNQVIAKITHMIALPGVTSEGYKVLLYRLAEFEYSKLCFADAVRYFCSFNDVRLSEDGLAEGYVVLFDMKGCSLGHLTRVTLPALRVFMNYIQNGHPARLKKIHVVNTASFINQVMMLVKPLIHSNLMNLLNLTTQGPSSVVDVSLLPSDYGGPLKTVAEIYKEQRENLEQNYREWLIESECFKADDKKRVKKPSRSMISHLTGGFKNLDID